MQTMTAALDFHMIGYAQEIILGAGSLAHLAGAVERFGWRHLMLCASPSLRSDGYSGAIQSALGGKLAACYERVQAHVPDFQLAEALEMAAENQVDAIIGLGGGSSIGMAKAVSLALEERRSGRPARAAHPTDSPLIPVTAIPTTYAGSEMTPVYGVTYHTDGSARKITVKDPKIAPRLVIYDPKLTLSLPSDITAASGINALAHCIEALYSISRNPIASAAAEAGIRYISGALPRCTADGSDLEARTEMFVGSHLAGAALATTAMGLHHGLCHVLGGTANVPHGIANSIMLPHAMRFNLDATMPQLAQAARAMGVASAKQDDESAAEAAVEGVYQLVGQLGLPQRLRDVGVKRQDLPHLAELALQSHAVRDNTKPVAEAAQALAIFQAAW